MLAQSQTYGEENIPAKSSSAGASTAATVAAAFASPKATAADIGFRPIADGRVAVLSLPAAVPLQAVRHADQQQEDAQTSETFRTKSAQLGSGVVGRYRVHASGRVSMDIHGVPLRVEAGVPRQHHEQLVATVVQGDGSSGSAPSGGDFVSIGAVHGHLVTAIDLESLLEQTAGHAGQAKRKLVDAYEAMPRK
jgi:zona occludens toxin (predicted ATPase)